MSETQTSETLKELEASIKAKVLAVSDSPEDRYRLREDFYHAYGYKIDEKGDQHGLGTSELAFLRWEIKRGVLNPENHPTRPGSPWWRAVNLDFIYNAELARAIHEAGIEANELPPNVEMWLEYIKNPSGITWYRAHNCSIVHGYHNHIELAKREKLAEKLFLNEVLYRVLFAQAMVENTREGMGRLGQILANPRLPSVNVLVHMADFYPQHYPLSHEDMKHIRHEGHSLQEIAVDFLDDLIILPKLGKLYAQCAQWLKASFILSWHKVDAPVYPDLHDKTGLYGHVHHWIIAPLKALWNFIKALVSGPFRKREKL
ncbi:MAG: hypothetical protein R3D00_22670 [Bacteroidia bacterium]